MNDELLKSVSELLDQKLAPLQQKIEVVDDKLSRLEEKMDTLAADVEFTYQKTSRNELEINRLKQQ
ncbi:hypothetical protein LBW89_02840 [Paenibacillus sp. alder61]|uniref:hypothetical protein n=1 Tax=Paenibacillus sp. alder61 TaxID=2862948 RepID=UPI001CD21444|nr:hypothetical protein [Paenibacillus sp. alder61]MCA1291950.1 hypothetical protein [Paenibacillus sp. alder61]